MIAQELLSWAQLMSIIGSVFLLFVKLKEMGVELKKITKRLDAQNGRLFTHEKDIDHLKWEHEHKKVSNKDE